MLEGTGFYMTFQRGPVRRTRIVRQVGTIVASVSVCVFVLLSVFQNNTFTRSTEALDLYTPSKYLDLDNWKITLPVGDYESPTQIKNPRLESFRQAPFFVADAGSGAVRFRAPVNGVTTSGSSYPRSELGEVENGRTARWKSYSGTHIMYLDQAITALPKTKRQVVAGQIHDSRSDVVAIRLTDNKLAVHAGSRDVRTLDSNYTLGKRFTVRFQVNDGVTRVYYNNSKYPVYTLNRNYSGAYFKAGAYTQSNCRTERWFQCNSGNFGEVVIYNIGLKQ